MTMINNAKTVTTTQNIKEEENKMMNTVKTMNELTLIAESEWGDCIISGARFEPEEYEKLKELAETIGSSTIYIFEYDNSWYDEDEMPNEVFRIGEFYVYGKMYKAYTWYIAPIKWNWTPGDNVWMHMSAADTVKLYPYCLEEGCWPSLYTEYDEDGEEYTSLKIGEWFVYEEEDGKIALLQY